MNEIASSEKKEMKNLNLLSPHFAEAEFKPNEKGIPQLVCVWLEGRKFSFEQGSTDFTIEDLNKAAFRVLGIANFQSALDILLDFANSLPQGLTESSFNNMLSLIVAQRPRDSIEAILIAQVALLNTYGLYMLRNGIFNDMIPQADFSYKTGLKMINLSHQAVHTLAKHRTQGVQQVNVVHMTDNAKAIFTGGGQAQN